MDAPLPHGQLGGDGAVAGARGRRANQVPREMTRADMDTVRDEFVRAAQMAERAGFDMLELHYAHGYLMSAFITPLTNRRTDAYGGSLENRMRFPLEVLPRRARGVAGARSRSRCASRPTTGWAPTA